MGQIKRDIISTSVQEKVTVPLAGEISAKRKKEIKPDWDILNLGKETDVCAQFILKA